MFVFPCVSGHSTRKFTSSEKQQNTEEKTLWNNRQVNWRVAPGTNAYKIWFGYSDVIYLTAYESLDNACHLSSSLLVRPFEQNKGLFFLLT